MEKEQIEEQKQWVVIDLGGLSQALTESAWMSEVSTEAHPVTNCDDLYHIEVVERPYIHIPEVKKTVKEYWKDVYDRLYKKYKSLIMEFKRPTEDGDNEKSRENTG